MAATATTRAAQPPHEGGPALGAFARALRSEAHVLRGQPQLTFQQLRNWLQWGDAAQQPVVPAREARSTPRPRLGDQARQLRNLLEMLSLSIVEQAEDSAPSRRLAARLRGQFITS
jgi:hypothetical protein